MNNSSGPAPEPSYKMTTPPIKDTPKSLDELWHRVDDELSDIRRKSYTFQVESNKIAKSLKFRLWLLCLLAGLPWIALCVYLLVF